MIISADKNTLSKKDGKSWVSGTILHIKCDGEGCSKKWNGKWANYKDKEEGFKTYCVACLNKLGTTGMKNKTHSDEWKAAAAERMTENNPTKSEKVRRKISKAVQKRYETEPGYWYGKSRPEHSLQQAEFMRKVHSISEENKDFREDLRQKYVTSKKRVTKFQKEVFYNLHAAGYDKFEMEVPIEKDGVLFVADIVDITKKIAVFCNGDYFHARPGKYKATDKVGNRTAEQIWQKDKDNLEFIKNLGYKVIVIWYDDWQKADKLNYPWKSLI